MSMAAKGEIVYIKADRNIEVDHPDICLGDVLQIECIQPNILAKIKSLRLLRFHSTDDKRQHREAVSILKVISCIHKEYPGIQIENYGENDFIVTYESGKTPGKAVHWMKAALVILIGFFGAAFSTMAFNNDVDVSKMFGQIYKQLTGTTSDGFTILEFTYSIGLAIGILTFFNHFGKKRFSVDPTPMEVEMRLYENDIQTTLIENISRKGKELDVDADPTGSHRT